MAKRRLLALVIILGYIEVGDSPRHSESWRTGGHRPLNFPDYSEENVAATIVALVDDLFFLAKIQETARSVGVGIARIDARRGVEAVAEAQPVLVLLDLNSRSLHPLEWIRNLKGDPTAKSIRIIGFVSHVQEQLIADAKAAGCDSVMARSAFSQQLPNLLKSLAAETTS